MNIVKKLNKHTIYYYCDDKIKYYINVPHRDFDATNISLEFLEDTSNFEPQINDIELIKSNVIDYYEKVDFDNITLVLPILKREEKQSLLNLDINKLNLIEKLMSLYINSSYIMLTKNKINVNKEVFLIENNTFNKFINYFKNKHNSRIIVKRLIEVNNTQKSDNKKENVKPFSINENILNEVSNKFSNEITNDEINVKNDLNTSNNESKLKLKKDSMNSLKKMEGNKSKDINNYEKGITNNSNETESDLNSSDKTSVDNKEKEELIINKEKMKNEGSINNITSDQYKVTNIINPNEITKKSEKKIEPVNNVININDLGSLATGGLNGALPGNVTINIEKLVTENNKNVNSSKKDEDDADEVSELDEDISDIDEFDENEDFDLDAIDVSEAVLSNDDGNKTYRTVTSGGVKFVVGKKDDENLKPIEINKNNSIDLNESQNLKIDLPTNIVKGDDQINKNAGFASYFTLFFVAISAIFLIIYIIIK